MSHSDSSQYFPSALKWASLSFFTVVILLAAISITVSPQRMAKDQSSTDGANAPSSLQNPSTSPVKSPQESIAGDESDQLLGEQIELQTESITPTTTQIQNTPNANVSQSTPTPAQQSNKNSSCNTGEIKGVIIGERKFYYEMGRQKYYVIERQPGVLLGKCFDTISSALREGYRKAPNFSIIQQLIRSLK